MIATAPIAELKIAAPEKFDTFHEFKPKEEKLMDFSDRCASAIDEQTNGIIEEMKRKGKLLPLPSKKKY